MTGSDARAKKRKKTRHKRGTLFGGHNELKKGSFTELSYLECLAKYKQQNRKTLSDVALANKSSSAILHCSELYRSFLRLLIDLESLSVTFSVFNRSVFHFSVLHHSEMYRSVLHRSTSHRSLSHRLSLYSSVFFFYFSITSLRNVSLIVVSFNYIL